MFRFLHAADIHLDSPLRGLERYEGAPVDAIRQSTRRAFENLVELALGEKVAFVLIAGDLYDGSWDDYNTGLFFCRQAARLGKAGIPLFLIAGNHDAESRMTRRLDLPKNVYSFGTNQASTHRLEEPRVAVHGQSFATAAVVENLATAYPAAVPGYFNVGMLHTCATGREGHESYAPCTINDLLAKGYDYWALGHVHTREVIHADPPIVFPGNIQGRHIREPGAKGCTLVTVDERGTVALEFRPLDVLRWEEWSLDAKEIATGQDLLDRFADGLAERSSLCDGRGLALRLIITGNTSFHEELVAEQDHWEQQIRARATEESAGLAWIEKVRIRTRDAKAFEDPSLEDGPIGELLSVIQTLSEDDNKLNDLSETLADFRNKLPRELREGTDALDLETADSMKMLLGDVRELLLHGLLAGEEAS